MVTMATMKPPMPPMTSAGAITCMASSGGALKKRFQVHAAVATQQMSRMPVLLTVPDTVMLSPSTASPVRKASELSAGFEVLINWAMRSLLTLISLPIRRAGRYLDSLERLFAFCFLLFAFRFLLFAFRSSLIALRQNCHPERSPPRRTESRDLLFLPTWQLTTGY